MLNYTLPCRGRDKKPGDNILDIASFEEISNLERIYTEIDVYDYEKEIKNSLNNFANTHMNELFELIQSSIKEASLGNVVAALRSNAD